MIRGNSSLDNTSSITQTCRALPASLSQLAAEINSQHQAVETAAMATIQHAKAAGDLLRQAKGTVGHGNWLAWLKANCKFTERTAQRYMSISERWADISKTTRVSDLTMREGLRLLAEVDQLEDLPPEGRHALEGGFITIGAARHLLRLSVLDKVATRGPWSEQMPELTWYNLACKKILWRPRYARTEKDIGFEVDSDLFDLHYLAKEYATLSEEEALELATANMADPQHDQQGLCSPEFWWGRLWLWMKPDFSRLDDHDMQMLDLAAGRYRDVKSEYEPDADWENEWLERCRQARAARRGTPN